ncbi:MAG: PqqD family protein [Actinomycetia bacterium]|nr:PqqD family protein [Actinomycetes bacterium]
MELRGEIVALNEQTLQLHHLTPAASALWRDLDGTSSLKQISSLLARAEATDETRLEAEIIRLASELFDLDLVAINHRDRQAHLAPPDPSHRPLS